MANEKESKLINATGLWKNKDKNGNTYLTGLMGGVRVLVFPVKEKKSDKHPDYTLCFTANEPQEAKPSEPEENFP